MILLWKIIIYGVILMKKVLFILLTEVIIKEAGPTIDLDSLPNLANTDYSPNSLSNGNESVITPYGLSFARGTVGCYVISKYAYCPWTIQVGGDVIAYSNVKVTIQKHHGFLNGGWKNYKLTFSAIL